MREIEIKIQLLNEMIALIGSCQKEALAVLINRKNQYEIQLKELKK
jgi:hypothetical protein